MRGPSRGPLKLLLGDDREATGEASAGAAAAAAAAAAPAAPAADPKLHASPDFLGVIAALGGPPTRGPSGAPSASDA